MPRQQLPGASGGSESAGRRDRVPTVTASARCGRTHSPALLLAAMLVVATACGSASNGERASNSRARAVGRAELMSTQPVVYVPNSIDYTGTKDVTNALQSFIDQVNNGSDVRFHPNGNYRVEGTLFVTDKTLTFDGENATFFATTAGLSNVPCGGSRAGAGSSSATSRCAARIRTLALPTTRTTPRSRSSTAFGSRE